MPFLRDYDREGALLDTKECNYCASRVALCNCSVRRADAMLSIRLAGITFAIERAKTAQRETLVPQIEELRLVDALFRGFSNPLFAPTMPECRLELSSERSTRRSRLLVLGTPPVTRGVSVVLPAMAFAPGSQQSYPRHAINTKGNIVAGMAFIRGSGGICSA